MSRSLRHTALLYISLVAVIAAGCSTVPDTRSADELTADDRAELLEGICPDSADRRGCTRCPDFLKSKSSGPLQLERVVYGGFSIGGADEAMVEFSGCGGSYVVAMERTDDAWSRFGWQPEFSLQDCQHVEREDGNVGLVCHLSPDLSEGHEGSIKQLGVNDGELQWRELHRYTGERGCRHALPSFTPRIRWRVDDAGGKIAMGWERSCLRTRPGQDLCEVDTSEVEQMTEVHSKSAELDWSDMHGSKPLGDFCDRADIQEVALAQAPALEACLQEADEGARTGYYVLQWKVMLDGKVRDDGGAPSVSIARGPEEAPEVEACFRRALAEMQFDKPNGGICLVNFPFHFHEGKHWENACSTFDPPPQEWLEAAENL